MRPPHKSTIGAPSPWRVVVRLRRPSTSALFIGCRWNRWDTHLRRCILRHRIHEHGEELITNAEALPIHLHTAQKIGLATLTGCHPVAEHLNELYQGHLRDATREVLRMVVIACIVVRKGRLDRLQRGFELWRAVRMLLEFWKDPLVGVKLFWREL